MAELAAGLAGRRDRAAPGRRACNAPMRPADTSEQLLNGRNATMPPTPTEYPPVMVFSMRPMTCKTPSHCQRMQAHWEARQRSHQ